VETLYPDIENTWQFVFKFESRQAGYGDRTGQALAEVITPHEAIITVAQDEVTSAMMDDKWDMLTQRMLSAIEDTTWILTSYTGNEGTHQALEDVTVTLILTSEEKRLGGIAGCNSYGAPYEIEGSELVLTDNIIQTLMACEDDIMEQEAAYLQALQEAGNYEIDGDRLTITGGGWTLEFEKQQ